MSLFDRIILPVPYFKVVEVFMLGSVSMGLIAFGSLLFPHWLGWVGVGMFDVPLMYVFFYLLIQHQLKAYWLELVKLGVAAILANILCVLAALS